MPTKNKKILAIDPGYERVGIAILEQHENEKHTLIHSECFKTNSKTPFYERVSLIGSHIKKIVKQYNPSSLAIEKLYFTANQKTAMNVAEARGVIIYEAIQNKLNIFEYTPMEIKVAVTGYGKATKQDVFHMTQKLILLPKDRIFLDDEIDAIAIGLTCFAIEKKIYQ